MSHAASHPAPSFGPSCPRLPRVTTGGMLIALAAAAALVACGRSDQAPREVEASPRPKAAVKATPSKELAKSDVADESPPPLSAEDEALEQRADEIMAAHPEMSAQDLLNVPEVNATLRGFLQALSQSKGLQARVNSSIAFAATMKNLQGPKENWQFSMDLKSYDAARTRRLLTSLLSEKPSRVVDFFEHEVTEAASEFTFDPAAAKSGNGISLEPKPATPPKE